MDTKQPLESQTLTIDQLLSDPKNKQLIIDWSNSLYSKTKGNWFDLSQAIKINKKLPVSAILVILQVLLEKDVEGISCLMKDVGNGLIKYQLVKGIESQIIETNNLINYHTEQIAILNRRLHSIKTKV